MRIAIAISRLQGFTGSETFCLDLIAELVADGHAVDVFVVYSSPEVRRRVRALDARAYTYPDFPAERPDRAIVMHPLATTLFLRRLPRQVPVLAIVQSPMPDEAPVKIARIDRFVAVSPFLADMLVAEHKIARRHMTVIPNGVDVSRLSAPERRGCAGPIDVLWASTFSYHGRYLAFSALSQAVCGLLEARLLVVDTPAPRELVAERPWIRLLPPASDFREILRQADVVCALGPGRIVLEAVAMNIPAICLNVHGKGEFFTERTRSQVEYYFDEWGSPLERLLQCDQIAHHQNQRSVILQHYDRRQAAARIRGELIDLRRRRWSPPRYLAPRPKQLRFVLAEYVNLLGSLATDDTPGLDRRPQSLLLKGYRGLRKFTPARFKAATRFDLDGEARERARDRHAGPDRFANGRSGTSS